MQVKSVVKIISSVQIFITFELKSVIQLCVCVQLLAQMGLAGQTLLANSDGTISVDGSLLTIQGRPVQLASQ